MQRSFWPAVTLALLGACSSPGAGVDPSPDPDAGAVPDAELGPQVTLDALGALFVAVQPDGGDWQVLSPHDDGRYSFSRPDGPYALVYVCPVNSGDETKTILAGPDDGDTWGDVCFHGDDYQPLDVQAAFASSVYVNRSTWSVPNTGVPTAAAGVIDVGLVTHTAAPYFAIARDVAIDGPTTLSVAVADYAPMVQSDLTITGATGGFSTPELELGRQTWMQLQGLPRPASGSLWLVPPDALRAGDVQVHRFATSFEGTGQWAEVDRGPGRSIDAVAVTLDGTPATATLHLGQPAPTIEIDAAGAWDVVRAETFPAEGVAGDARWSLTAHPGWLAAHPFDGIVRFPDVTTADGWDPAWTLGTELGFGVRLGETVEDGVIRGVQYYDYN